jgi:hypothetical protein
LWDTSRRYCGKKTPKNFQQNKRQQNRSPTRGRVFVFCFVFFFINENDNNKKENNEMIFFFKVTYHNLCKSSNDLTRNSLTLHGRPTVCVARVCRDTGSRNSSNAINTGDVVVTKLRQVALVFVFVVPFELSFTEPEEEDDDDNKHKRSIPVVIVLMVIFLIWDVTPTTCCCCCNNRRVVVVVVVIDFGIMMADDIIISFVFSN